MGFREILLGKKGVVILEKVGNCCQEYKGLIPTSRNGSDRHGMQLHGLTLAHSDFYWRDWGEPYSGWALSPRPAKHRAGMSTKCVVTLRITLEIRTAMMAATGVNT